MKFVKANVSPLIKFVGGKRGLLPQIYERIPKKFNTYHEPFVGGGALFFSLMSELDHDGKSAFISDSNPSLIRMYSAVANNVEGLIYKLKRMKHSQENFLKVRSKFLPDLPTLDLAASLIYLNKTCFNGIYRVNQKGHFNVPYGHHKNPTICNEENLRDCSRVLKNAVIRCSSFTDVLDDAKKGDFVYFDPPYLPISETSNFVGYTIGGFGLTEHKLLRDIARALKTRGVHVLISNGDHEKIRALYAKGFKVEEVTAPRAVNSKGSGRGHVTELLIS